jgi:hypothetical protein
LRRHWTRKHFEFKKKKDENNKKKKRPVAGFDYDVYKSFASQTFDVVVVVVAQAFPFASSSFSHQQS